MGQYGLGKEVMETEKGLPDKPDFNDFTPVGMTSGRGDFQLRGLVGQPLVTDYSACSGNPCARSLMSAPSGVTR